MSTLRSVSRTIRPRAKRQRPEAQARPLLLCVLLVLPLLWAALATPVHGQAGGDPDGDDGLTIDEAGPGPDWKVLGRRHMGTEGWHADYTVTLSVPATVAMPLDPGQRPPLRFDVHHRANGTPVQEDRPLQVFLFVCQPPAEGPRADVPSCDPATRQDTELGVLLRLTDEGPADGPSISAPAYVYEPQDVSAFGTEATWYVEAAFTNPAINETAVFVITVGHPEVNTILDTISDIGVDTGDLFRIFSFVVVLTLFYIIGRALTYVLNHTVFTPARMEATAVRLVNRLILVVVLFIGLAMSLWVVWSVNVWAVLTALGLLSVALGFGMQNTVANLMGGISLAIDKPFMIGDRIQVGDSWGDVLAIGMRSTTIETPKKEIVIIPNKLLDEREIWNYTLGHPEMRLDLLVNISYDSDWRLAQVLMLEAAQENEEILDYPRPAVHMRDFGDSSVKLQLRCWMAAAKNMRVIDSNLRKAIKDKFDAEGVEIPYPYRTIVHKRELPKPRPVTQDDMDRVALSDRGTTRMLVLASGVEPARRSARLVVRVARELDVAMVLAHIKTRVDDNVRRTAHQIFGFYKNAAQAYNVEVQTRVREGDLVEQTLALIKELKVDLVVLGSGRTNIFGAPTKVSDLTRQLRTATDVPILVVPKNLVIPDRTVEHYRRRLERRSAERKQAERAVSADDTRDPDAPSRPGQAALSWQEHDDEVAEAAEAADIDGSGPTPAPATAAGAPARSGERRRQVDEDAARPAEGAVDHTEPDAPDGPTDVEADAKKPDERSGGTDAERKPRKGDRSDERDDHPAVDRRRRR